MKFVSQIIFEIIAKFVSQIISAKFIFQIILQFIFRTISAKFIFQIISQIIFLIISQIIFRIISAKFIFRIILQFIYQTQISLTNLPYLRYFLFDSQFGYFVLHYYQTKYYQFPTKCDFQDLL